MSYDSHIKMPMANLTPLYYFVPHPVFSDLVGIPGVDDKKRREKYE
jgi:hypothetical protein